MGDDGVMCVGGGIIYVIVVKDGGVYFVFVDLVGKIGDLVVWNCGMLGGLLVNNDLFVCYLLVVLVSGVIIVMDCCMIEVDDFF